MKKKKQKQEPAGQELDYSKLDASQLDACENQLKGLIESSSYQEMKEEYIRRRNLILAEKGKAK